MEDIWLQAKVFVRKYDRLCKSFGVFKCLFKLVIHLPIFESPKFFSWGYFSQIISIPVASSGVKFSQQSTADGATGINITHLR